jgi:DNA-binding CsgD family transcriptional regulator
VLSEAEWLMLRREMRLSGREMQVVRGLCAEQSDDAISQALGIAPRTVRTHLESVFRKCGCHSRSGAVASAFKAYIARMKR